MAVSDVSLTIRRRFSDAEMEDACALVREAHWNQTAADWRIFLELGRVYAIHGPSGRMIATTTTLPFGGGFAWISMVLVATDYRRRGLATWMMRRVMDDLGAARLRPALDATPAGRAVYRALGFEDFWGFHRLERRARQDEGEHPPAPAGVIIRPLTDREWQPICIYDATAFGADRGAVLAALRGRLPPAELVAERDGRIAGFLLGRDGRMAAHVGPLIAEDDAIACALLARALPALHGVVFIDLADAKGMVRAWLEARGFVGQRPFTRMLYRGSARFDDAARTYAVVGPEFG
jgi:GNAT superfamily N-acetyltransferase